MNLKFVQKKNIVFRNERDWAQFHDPKNLAEALSIEAGELLENFLWKTTEQSRNFSPEELKNVNEEGNRYIVIFSLSLSRKDSYVDLHDLVLCELNYESRPA